MTIEEKIKSLGIEIWSKQDEIKKLHKIEMIQKYINSHFKEIITSLKVLIPEHSRTSCSDKKPNNIGECNRCTVLGMESDGIWDDGYTLDISIEKLK